MKLSIRTSKILFLLVTASVSSIVVALNAATDSIDPAPVSLVLSSSRKRKENTRDRFLARRGTAPQEAAEKQAASGTTIRRGLEDDACFDAQAVIEEVTSEELNTIYSGLFLTLDTCPIICLDPSDDPLNPTFAFPPTDVICTYGTSGTPEYENFLAQYEDKCKSLLDGRIEYLDLKYDGDECGTDLSKLVVVPGCFSNMCTKKQAVAWENQIWELSIDGYSCEITVKISKMKLPKAPKGCNRLKIPKGSKVPKAAKVVKAAKAKMEGAYKLKKGGRA